MKKLFAIVLAFTFSACSLIEIHHYETKDKICRPDMKKEARLLWIRDRDYEIESIDYEGYYGYSKAAGIARQMGFENKEIKDDVPLTLDLLQKFDAVIFLNIESEEPLTPREQKAFKHYIATGGAALVIGQQDGGKPLSREARFANSVTRPFGIQFSKEVPKATRRVAKQKITRGIKEVPGSGSTLVVKKPARSLAPAGGEKSVLAVSEYKQGRVVAVSDDSTFADVTLKNDDEKSEQMRKLFGNILRWMVK